MSDAVARGPLARLLLNPLTVLAGIVLGGLWGWFDHGGAPIFAEIGAIYVKLLQMCVIPLLFVAVVLSLSRLFADGVASREVARLALVIVVGLLIAGAFGAALGDWGEPGAELQQTARRVIGEVIIRAESAPAPDGLGGAPLGLADIVVNIVPENIFFALTSGNKLAVLFFAILFGVALGSLGTANARSAIALFDALYETFLRIIEWLMLALPVGLFCLAYAQVASVGVDVLVALTRLVALIYLGAAALLLLYSVVIWLCVGGGYWRAIGTLRQTLFVAFGTANSFAAVPSALRALKDGLGLKRSVVDLVMPLGITLNPPGSAFHFALATLFLANLYGVDLDAGQIAFVVFASALAGIASSGAPGIAALSMITIILVPLGLPVEVAIILLVAIDPIVDPILTAVNVLANAATTALLGRADAPAGQQADAADLVG